MSFWDVSFGCVNISSNVFSISMQMAEMIVNVILFPLVSLFFCEWILTWNRVNYFLINHFCDFSVDGNYSSIFSLKMKKVWVVLIASIGILQILLYMSCNILENWSVPDKGFFDETLVTGGGDKPKILVFILCRNGLLMKFGRDRKKKWKTFLCISIASHK